MNFNSLTKNILPEKIIVKKAKGGRFWDSQGKEYLDFSSQTLNLNLGNSPEIARKAFLEQFDKFTFLSSRFTSEVFVNLAKELVSIAPKGLTKVNLKLTNGSDANESAFKRVRAFHNKPIILSFRETHAGESAETLSTNFAYFKLKKLGGSRNFIHIDSPFVIGPEKSLKKIEKLFRRRNDIAGFIIEPIMVNAGGYIFSKGFLQKVSELCSFYKISLIFDEIQTAFGWLGTFFAASYYQVIPDLLTLGKGLGSGFPIAAVLMKREYDVLSYGEDEFTYGGHPISCAIALENIRFLKSTKIFENVKLKSKILVRQLVYLSEKFNEMIKEVRICGLIASIEFFQKGNFNYANSVYKEALTRGLVLRKSMDGQGPSLIIKPPIIVSEEEINKAIKILIESIETVRLREV